MTISTSIPYAPYVLIAKAAELTGYTRKAIEVKIERGVWVEGREWLKAPDGHRMINIKAFVAWVESGGRPAAPRRRVVDAERQVEPHDD